MPATTVKVLEEKLANELEIRDARIQHLESALIDLKLLMNDEIQSLERRVKVLEYAKVRSDIIQELHMRLIDDQNQYSRKTNLIIGGLKVGDKASDKDIRRLILNEIRELDLDIDPREVDRAHRTGKTYTDRKGVRHTNVIVRFTSWYARNCFYEARKDSRLYVKADLTARRQDLLKWALNKLEDDRRVSNLVNYIFSDRNCHLTVFTKDKRYLKFNSEIEFDNLMDFIEDTLPPMRAAFFAIDNGMRSAGDENVLVNLTDVNIEDWVKDPNNFYIGRDNGNVKGSIFQNPYSLNDYDRKTAISMYKDHIMSSPEIWNEVVPQLNHKTLGCFCWPEQCHGNVLLDILNR